MSNKIKQDGNLINTNGKWKIVSGECKEAKEGWKGCWVVDDQRRLTVKNFNI